MPGFNVSSRNYAPFGENWHDQPTGFSFKNQALSCLTELQITEDCQKSKGKAWLSLSLVSTFSMAKHDKIIM